MAQGDGKKSLQDVLRSRREAPALLSPAEAAKRESARRREEVETAAADAFARWRDGRSPDARGKLVPEAYRALFRLSPAAYDATAHWGRRAKAQLALEPVCAVERCGAETGLAARHLTHATLGEEEPGRDLVTLCDRCNHRAEKLGRELGRVPRREELAALDPRRPLYRPADIAALKAKYGR
jgi:5-methylcytosine-specific restriction endonuclease McrA